MNVNGGNGGFDQFVFHHADSTLVEATADVVNNFTTFSDNIRLFLQNDVTNLQAFPGLTYFEAVVPVANFAAALQAANLALNNTGLTQVDFQFDALNGYLFQDIEGDGTVDQVVILTGIDNNEFSHFNVQ